MNEVYLCFHGLGTPPPRVSAPERPFWLPPKRFVEIVGLVRKYQTASRRIHLTFDDGNKSDAGIALPILQEHKCRGLFFVSSDAIGEPDFMEVADIVSLHDAGMTIGSHGADHVKWTTLPSSELTEQVRRSIGVLSCVVGEPVNVVAPPFGDYNRRVLKVLRRLKVSAVFTTDDGEARCGAWVKTRFTVRTDTPLDDIEARLSGRVDRMRRLRNYARQFVRQFS
jgi:peptidoglycan/xylan/chitin deacetylase (PgdA/CDA1 family)